MGKYTYPSNLGKDERISFSAGYGSEVSYGTHSCGGVRSGRDPSVPTNYYGDKHHNAGDKKGGHERDICRQPVSSTFT